ncbi:MAG: ABC transporter ATP-binding protein/permease [Bacteroidota bacterium]|nr:ABC transporter ATP-binding protein/permease [Bacteroidota bacterium]
MKSQKKTTVENKNGKKAIERLTIKDRLGALTNLPRFLKLVYQTSPSLTIFNAILRLSLSVLPLVMLYVGKLIIDQVVILVKGNHAAGVSHTQIWKLVLLEFALVILLNAFNRIVLLFDTLLGDLFANHTSIKIMSHAATLDLDQFEDSVFYDKLERARQQSSGRAMLLSQVLTQIQDMITMSFLGVGLIIFNPWFTFILLFSTIPSFIGEYYFNSKTYSLARSQVARRRELEYVSYLGASDLTAKEVRVFGLADFFIDRFRSVFNNLYVDSRNLATKRTIWGIGLTMLGTIGYYVAFIFIIQRVIVGALTIGSLTFLLGSIRQLGSSLQSVIKRFSTVSQGALYLKDFFDFFEITPKMKIPSNPRPFPKPIKHGFTFENVGFKYINTTRWANRNLNFTLHAGEKLALVGENGAGKTTLVKLLVRLYDPTEGRILLDGYDLREYNLTELRMEIGIIFQDFLRYQMTTNENIAVGNIKELNNQELIIKSAKQSLASPIIDRLPKKYEQMLGRHFSQGVELSGGEWQKVALARAYMRDAQLMILDEPTAALDARSEYEVFQRFAELTENKSAMLISHRFSTVRMANRILVLEKGEIREIGSHEELLEKGGQYAELFQLQAMGYR